MATLKAIAWLFALGLPVTALAQSVAPPQTLRAEPPPPQLRALFEHCDGDHSAALSWTEFESCWRQLRAGRLRTLSPAPPAASPNPLPPSQPAAPLPAAVEPRKNLDDAARSTHEH
ncbi:hypothetical protein [Stenotrophomonas sp.]|uniref:hypothetical protein n=1 Tax=Stenotrophomonas sp. TaxID=69392 RepID=UPI0028ABB682|nr:hypothetical protein [Stenotrophomonas sp.]